MMLFLSYLFFSVISFRINNSTSDTSFSYDYPEDNFNNTYYKIVSDDNLSKNLTNKEDDIRFLNSTQTENLDYIYDINYYGFNMSSISYPCDMIVDDLINYNGTQFQEFASKYSKKESCLEYNKQIEAKRNLKSGIINNETAKYIKEDSILDFVPIKNEDFLIWFIQVKPYFILQNNSIDPLLAQRKLMPIMNDILIKANDIGWKLLIKYGYAESFPLNSHLMSASLLGSTICTTECVSYNMEDFLTESMKVPQNTYLGYSDGLEDVSMVILLIKQHDVKQDFNDAIDKYAFDLKFVLKRSKKRKKS